MFCLVISWREACNYVCATFRVPTQIVFSNSLCFPCVFPVQPPIFPVPIYIICDYYTHKTELADLSSFWKKMEIFVANIAISFTLRISEFTTWANTIPCVLAKFPNSLCFPWQGISSLFSLCRAYPVLYLHTWLLTVALVCLVAVDTFVGVGQWAAQLHHLLCDDVHHALRTLPWNKRHHFDFILYQFFTTLRKSAAWSIAVWEYLGRNTSSSLINSKHWKNTLK